MRPVTMVLAVAHRELLVIIEAAAAWSLLKEDGRRWQEWARGIRYDSQWRAAILRSCSPSGF